jgi:ketosteroid isomerase-like protein
MFVCRLGTGDDGHGCASYLRENANNRRQRLRLISLVAGGCLAGLAIPPALAQPVSAEAEIRVALTQWVADFNAGRADKVCDIYAPSLRGDVRGTPERDFDAHCKLLHEVLGDPSRSFSLKLVLRDVVAERDMAAVRLVWILTTRDTATGQASTAEKQGLDIFGRGSDGAWRILRFMNYEQP